MSEYKNSARIDVGLDFSKDFGTVAAAHDDGKVALYSVRTGNRLPSPAVDKIHSGYGAIHCVQFEPFPGDTMPTLFVGERGNINAYTLGSDDTDDEAEMG